MISTCFCAFLVACAPDGFDDDALRTSDLDQAAVIRQLNEWRVAAGVRPVEASATIHLAAGRHAAYYLRNRGRLVGAEPLAAHAEYPWWPGFSGATAADRLLAAGFREAIPLGDEMHFVGDGPRALRGWIDSVYHRVDLLQPDTTHVGHASLQDEQGGVDVLDLGFVADRDAERVALWPVDGATDVPLSFDGFEAPEPPRPPQGWPSGYVISAHFARNRFEDVRIRDAVVRVNGAAVEHLQLDAHDEVHAHDSAFVYAASPLPPGALVEVALTVDTDGAARELRWSFHTCTTSAEEVTRCRE